MQSESPAEDFHPDRRLHPLSWIFIFLQFGQALLPLIFVVLVGGKRDEAFIRVAVAGILTVPILLNALWLQFTYRYGFSGRGLVIREGVFFRNVRTIDYSRIENVDTRRNPLHRLLGVAQVQVETSSGGKAEASIRVLGMSAVEEMQAHIFKQKSQMQETSAEQTAVAEEQPEELLLHLPPVELIRYGLIDNRGMVLVAAAVALLADADVFSEETMKAIFRRATAYHLPDLGWMTTATVAVALFIVLVAAIRVLSIILAFLVLYDFRLSRKGNDLLSRHGLFTRVSHTLRQRRIQMVHQRSGLLHRLFNRTSLQVDLAGGVAASDGAAQGNQNAAREVWLAPLCLPADAEQIIRTALPQADLAQLQWHGLASRASYRMFRKGLVLWLIFITLPAAWFIQWWCVGVFLLGFPCVWINARLYVKYTGWALTGAIFIYRRGWLNRKISIAPINRIQSIRLAESPFDRRWQMANLTIDTAGSGQPGRRLGIRYLDGESAQKLTFGLYSSQLIGTESPGIQTFTPSQG